MAINLKSKWIASSLTLLAMTTLTLPAQAKDCVDWGRVYAQEAIRSVAVKPILIQIAPFKNDTELKGDEWIGDGVAHLLENYLSSQSAVAALPVAVVKYLPSDQRVSYAIEGMFQHGSDWLRIFIQLKNNEGKIIAQWPVETPFPLHKQFFSGLRKTAEEILKKLGKEKIDPAPLAAIENETNKVYAFENYIKGKQALETYDRNKMEVALIWFQEARREDQKYSKAYQGLAQTYTFLFLDHKQRGENFAPDLEALQNTLKEMGKRTGQTIDLAEYPLLKAHVHYVSGKRSLDKNQHSQAISELEKAFALVPYDTTTAYALYQSYARLGKVNLAGKYLNAAQGVNACLKK